MTNELPKIRPTIFKNNHLSLKNTKIVECKIVIIFLSISCNMCFGCSKESSHPDGSFVYPQHMFWLRNKKNNFQLHTLTWGPETLTKTLS